MPDGPNVFEAHTPPDQVDKLLKKGEYFEGTIRMNAANRNRAFVHVKDFPVDVLIEGQKNMNRAMDGDQVVVWLERTKWWSELPNAKVKRTQGQGGYSNDQAVESRIVDQELPDKDCKIQDHIE